MAILRILRVIAVLGCTSAGLLVAGQPPRTGESDKPEPPATRAVPLDPALRARIEAEAAGQSSEADRRFKAGDYRGALPLYQAERASRAKLSDRRYEAYAARAEGCCLAGLGDDEAAIAAWLDAARIDAGRDDPGFEGYDWLLIANAYFRLRRPEEIVRALDRAIPKLSNAADRDHEADARILMARTLIALDHPEDASPHAERAIALAEMLDDTRRLAPSWLAGGLADLRRGTPGLAAERIADALGLFEEFQATADLPVALQGLGEAFADLELLPAAIAAFKESAAQYETLGDLSGQSMVLGLLAAAEADQGQLDAAVTTAGNVVAIARELDDPEALVESLVRYGHYQTQNQDRSGAAESVAAAVEAGRDALPPARFVRLLLLCAGVERKAGHATRAASRLAEAERIARGADNAALRRLVEDERARLQP